MALDPTRRAKADAVLAGMATGLSLRKASIAADVTAPTFLLWVSQDPDLAEQYARARDAVVDHMADELMDVVRRNPTLAPDGKVDSGEVQHRRLLADTLKWTLSKVAPKRYGDRLEVDVGAETKDALLDAMMRIAHPRKSEGQNEPDRNSDGEDRGGT